MLFNSYAFIFVFLPVALLGYQMASHFHRRAVIAWLGLISLAFYAYWRPVLLLLLLASIVLNYSAALLMSRQSANSSNSRALLVGTIVLNLGVLGYFKYFFPVINFFGNVIDGHALFADVVLPLGISFFTFTQIAYLIDIHQGTAKVGDPLNYVLFVTFFPHLIAGPILHHQEMMPQFEKRTFGLRANDVAVGMSWFIMGLAKKVLIADNVAPMVNAIFDSQGHLPATLAWRASLGYAVQLYFDFSGYSDMALGLARMFSINFPLNFSSPYKATSVIDFWQRWHITLSRYITTYLFSPMQLRIINRRQAQGKRVSRKAFATLEGFMQMTAFPMLYTMLIAGIWHGAGMQYIVFGLLHGCYLTVNHAWRHFRPRGGARPGGGARQAETPNPSVVAAAVRRLGCSALTLLCVLVAQVFFRAGSVSQAISMLAGMLGLHGFGLHDVVAGESSVAVMRQTVITVCGLMIAWFLPNTQQILGRFNAEARTVWDVPLESRMLLWRPSAAWALVLSLAFFGALVSLQNPSTFLYFQF